MEHTQDLVVVPPAGRPDPLLLVVRTPDYSTVVTTLSTIVANLREACSRRHRAESSVAAGPGRPARHGPRRARPPRGAASQVQDQRPHAVPTRASRRSACRTAAGTCATLGTGACGSIEGQPCEFPCGQHVVHLLTAGAPWQHPPVRVLHPAPREASVDELYGGARQRSAERPWVGICMIASLDGSTVVDGRSGGLGNPTDASILGALRRGCRRGARRRRHGPRRGVGPPKQAGLRIGVVTASGRIDPASELFTSGAGFLVMPEDGPPAPPGIDVVRAGSGAVDLALAVRRLGDRRRRARLRPGRGGLAPQRCAAGERVRRRARPHAVTGVGGRRRTAGATSGAPETFVRFDLVHVATDDGYLYGRWVRRAG